MEHFRAACISTAAVLIAESHSIPSMGTQAGTANGSGPKTKLYSRCGSITEAAQGLFIMRCCGSNALEHFKIDGVAFVRAIQGNRRNMVVDVDEYSFAHDISLPFTTAAGNDRCR